MQETLYLLLRLVHTAAPVDPLLKRGLEYSQIAELIRSAEDAELVVIGPEGLALTSKGDELLRTDIRGAPAGSPGTWIRPLDEYRIPRLSPDDVYLPMFAPEAYVHGVDSRGPASP